MSKDIPARPDEPREAKTVVWDEKAIDILMSQVRFMLQHEAKSIKLDIVENIGAALARRSGIDKDLHELSARVEGLSQSIESLAGRVVELEKAQGIVPAGKGGPLGGARHERQS